MANAKASNELVLILDVNSKEASQVMRRFAGEIDKVQKEAAGAAGQLNKVAESGKKAERNWVQFAAKWGTVTAGFWAASRAIGGVVDALESGGRAIALDKRIDQIADGATKLEAAMRGIQRTVNETDLQGFVIQMDQIGLSAQQIEIATGYALAFSQTMGKELAPTLERVVQAFASGRATSFRALGIDANDAADAMNKMAVAAKAMAANMDDVDLSIKQARATVENFVSDVEVGMVKVAAAVIDMPEAFGDMFKAMEAGFTEGDIVAKFRELNAQIAESNRLFIEANRSNPDVFFNKMATGLDRAASSAVDALVKFSGLAGVIGMLTGEGPQPVGDDLLKEFLKRAEDAQSAARAALWSVDDFPDSGDRRRGRRGGRGQTFLGAEDLRIDPREAPFLLAFQRQQQGEGEEGGDPGGLGSGGPVEGLSTAVTETVDLWGELATGFEDSAYRIGGAAGSISLAMSQALGAMSDKKGATQAIGLAGAMATGITGAMAGMAWALVPFEIAQSAAAFATGNIPGGIQHAFAAVNYGIAAARGKKGGGGGGGSSSAGGGGFSAGTDFGQDRAGGQDKSPTYIYYVQTGGGDIVAGDTSSESWLLSRLDAAGARGETISPELTRRAGRGNSFGGSGGSGM